MRWPTDGVGAVAFIYDNGVYYGYCLNDKGYDAPPVTCDYSFPEGSKVQYKVCRPGRSRMSKVFTTALFCLYSDKDHVAGAPVGADGRAIGIRP
jgi:hypothetical protein